MKDLQKLNKEQEIEIKNLKKELYKAQDELFYQNDEFYKARIRLETLEQTVRLTENEQMTEEEKQNQNFANQKKQGEELRELVSDLKNSIKKFTNVKKKNRIM